METLLKEIADEYPEIELRWTDDRWNLLISDLKRYNREFGGKGDQFWYMWQYTGETPEEIVERAWRELIKDGGDEG